jgi:hypothetical protein
MEKQKIVKGVLWSCDSQESFTEQGTLQHRSERRKVASQVYSVGRRSRQREGICKGPGVEAEQSGYQENKGTENKEVVG